MKKLTAEEWQAKAPPIHWLHIKEVSDVQNEMIEKFLDARTDGWWYRSGSYYFFEKTSDRTLFKLWLNEQLPQDHGSL